MKKGKMFVLSRASQTGMCIPGSMQDVGGGGEGVHRRNCSPSESSDYCGKACPRTSHSVIGKTHAGPFLLGHLMAQGLECSTLDLL